MRLIDKEHEKYDDIGITESIGRIGNYYGGLYLGTDGVKFYWSIKNYDGQGWEEIPESLYKTLTRYEKRRQKGAGK